MTADDADGATRRPLVHYTPQSGWLNDPNGLVFHDGEYHLHYQHYPLTLQWGPMHWGHAVSSDLVSWTDLPVALRPDAHGTIYSGSAVVDHRDTAGFGRSALVAVYTQFTPATQVQSVAWSTDRGRTWRVHDGNPVLSPPAGVADFRDPKVFWYGGPLDGHWVMALAAGTAVRLFTSRDLLSWTPASVFAPEVDAPHGVWEMPDLFVLPVANSSDRRWVLAAGAATNGPAGGSATRYWVGEFDGETFTADPQLPVRWADHGADFYAAQSWSDVPDGRRLWIAWMSNWDYADRLPARGWRGQMTLPRELHLAGDACALVQRPIGELDRYLTPAATSSRHVVLETGAAWIRMRTTSASVGTAAVVLRAGPACVRVTYDASADVLMLDRSAATAADAGDGFGTVQAAPVSPGRRLDINVLVDRSSVEVFAQGGRVCLTDLVFGLGDAHAVSATVEGDLISHFDVRHIDLRRAD